jgi:hypothetical protein
LNCTPAYPFRGQGCYLILGKVVEECTSASVEVVKFVPAAHRNTNRLLEQDSSICVLREKYHGAGTTSASY